MTAVEFGILADRISLLWPPEMTAAQVDAYWRILKPLTVASLDQAITLIARQARSHRPDPGLLYETADAQPTKQLALPPAVDHDAVMALLGVNQTAEHRRRHEAVMAYVRRSGRRLSLGELWRLMPVSHCSTAEFDDRLAALHAALPGNSP